jgi:hypothetical protein
VCFPAPGRWESFSTRGASSTPLLREHLQLRGNDGELSQSILPHWIFRRFDKNEQTEIVTALGCLIGNKSRRTTHAFSPHKSGRWPRRSLSSAGAPAPHTQFLTNSSESDSSIFCECRNGTMFQFGQNCRFYLFKEIGKPAGTETKRIGDISVERAEVMRTFSAQTTHSIRSGRSFPCVAPLTIFYDIRCRQ